MKKTSLCYDCGEELNPFQENRWTSRDGVVVEPLCSGCKHKRDNRENDPPPAQVVGMQAATLEARAATTKENVTNG